MTFEEIKSTLHKYAEEYSIETYPAEHRNHLGISIIGEECWRKLWLGFRWAKLEQFEGRMRRLFNRGHREEDVFEQFLLWAGIKFNSINPDTQKQYKLSLINGHYGGSTDGIGTITWADNLKVILEFKTHNDKLFEQLKSQGLQKAHAKHWAQMCGYGKDFKIEHGLYAAVNKNNDELFFDIYKLDWNYAAELEKKAETIITSQIPLNRISEQPTYWKCKFCHFKGICFDNEPVEKNCRSCKFAQPIDNGQWHCNRFNSIIPKDFIAKGCDGHLSIMEGI